jgi:outer membrane autotransporter protein
VPAALSQLSGEVAVGAQHAGLRALDLFLGVMLNPFLHGRGEAGSGPALAFAPERQPLPRDIADAYAAAMPVKAPAAPPSFERRWSVWGSAYGGTSRTDGDALTGSHDTRANAYGFAIGVDHRLTPGTIVGFALAGGGTSWSLSSGLGTGRSDMFQAGVYGSHRFGAAYVSAAAAYTGHDASTSRLLTLVGPGQLNADFTAQSFGGRIEGGYRWLTAFAGVTPYAAAQVLSVRTPGTSETGTAAAFALAYASRTTTATRSELGVWLDRSTLVNPDTAPTLRARAAWAHDFNDDRQIAASFQALPLSGFTVFGASPASDQALVSAAAELRLRSGWSFALKGDGEFASHTRTYSGTGVARYTW